MRTNSQKKSFSHCEWRGLTFCIFTPVPHVWHQKCTEKKTKALSHSGVMFHKTRFYCRVTWPGSECWLCTFPLQTKARCEQMLRGVLTSGKRALLWEISSIASQSISFLPLINRQIVAAPWLSINSNQTTAIQSWRRSFQISLLPIQLHSKLHRSIDLDQVKGFPYREKPTAPQFITLQSISTSFSLSGFITLNFAGFGSVSPPSSDKFSHQRARQQS